MSRNIVQHQDKIGREIGRGTVQVNGRAQEVVVIQVGDGVYSEQKIASAASVWPVSADDLTQDAKIQFLRTAEQFRALGLSDEDLQRAFGAALARGQ